MAKAVSKSEIAPQLWRFKDSGNVYVFDGKKVLFGGDSFQAASRWNGTGGFCACNNSRFRAGYIRSAGLVLKWRPDMLANGHGCVYYFTPSRFNRIIEWTRFAERALKAICPSGSLEKDYYAVHSNCRWGHVLGTGKREFGGDRA